MAYYAHAVIECPDGSKIRRGAEVVDDLEGFDSLVEYGSVSEEPYDEAADKVVPEEVEIDGVRYVRSHDSAGVEGESGA